MLQNKKDTNERLLEVQAKYTIEELTGQKVEGEAKISLTTNALSISPKFNDPILLSLRDITKIEFKDYKIALFLFPNGIIVISELGYQYENVAKHLTKARNEIILKDLLMSESIKKSGLLGEIVSPEISGNCEVRLYSTALVILPDQGELIRIPYGTMKKIEEKDFALLIQTDDGAEYKLLKFGEKFKILTNSLAKELNDLSLMVQGSVKDMMPSASPVLAQQLAAIMKEGKATTKQEIEKVSPEFWQALLAQLKALGVKENYDFLDALDQTQSVSIGVKRGLMGGLTGDYLWFLIPICVVGSQKIGNVIAMEATSPNQKGKATYFFKITDRKDYAKLKTPEEVENQAKQVMKIINACMVKINFRREPIIVPTEKLNNPKYEKYKFAITKIPELQILRSLYVGKVIHTSLEQWKQDVEELLAFNLASQDNSMRWVKVREGMTDEDIEKEIEADEVFAENQAEISLSPETNIDLDKIKQDGQPSANN